MKGAKVLTRSWHLSFKPGALGDVALEIADASAAAYGGLVAISREALAAAILRTRLVEVALRGRTAVKPTRKGRP